MKHTVVRNSDYRIEQWFVVDETGRNVGAFSCWQDANNYARQLSSIGVKSTSGLDVITSNATTITGRRI